VRWQRIWKIWSKDSWWNFYFFKNGILSDYIIVLIFIISGKVKLFKDPLGDLRFKLEEGTLT
jgi:hypothetical protein